MPSTLATLPSHDLLEISKHLPPEEAMRFMQINKHFYTLFSTLLKDKDYWEKAIKQYFPANNAQRRSELSNLAYLSSFDKYVRLHQEYYEGLPARHIRLFSAVKSRDLFYLQEVKLTFDELNIVDALQNNLYVTIASIGHQPTMNYVFSTVITPFYKDKNKVFPTKKDISRGFTLLQHAASLNQASAIHAHFQWITATNSPRQTYRENVTPLHLAAKYGHLASVTALIAHGEAVNTPACYEDPLHLAAGNGHDATVETLLAHGANLHGNNPDSLLPPLYYAAKGGHLGTFNQCLNAEENILLPPEPLKDTTLLHVAIKGGNLDLLNQVIAMGIFDIDDPNGYGETPLFYAAKHGNFPAFERLLALEANPNDVNNDNEDSLLHAALLGMNTAIIKAVLELKEININNRNQESETPLHYAALYKKTNPEHDKIFDLLLEKGANTHAQVEDILETPLHYAAKNREDTYAIEALLKKGANANALNNGNQTPLHILMRTPSRHCLAKLNCLVAHQADIHAIDEYHLHNMYNIPTIEHPLPVAVIPTPPLYISHQTPLLLAAKNQGAEVITALLGYGADLEARDGNGNTPLHLATTQNHTEKKDKRDIIELLIQSGANLKAVNKNNETPLQYLLNQGTNFNLVDTFIAHGEVIEENALLHRLELKLCNVTISQSSFFALLRAAPNLGTLTLNNCTITKDSTSLDATTLPSNTLLCLKHVDASNSTMPLNDLFELLRLVLKAAPNLNGMNFPHINISEINQRNLMIFKDLHKKSNHPYATRMLAFIHEIGIEGINRDLFYAKTLYALVGDVQGVTRVEGKLKQLLNNGLFSLPQAPSSNNKRISEEKGSSPKRQKPC